MNLFDIFMVKPILFHGYDIWGFWKLICKKTGKFVKLILNIKPSNTINDIWLIKQIFRRERFIT